MTVKENQKKPIRKSKRCDTKEDADHKLVVAGLFLDPLTSSSVTLTRYQGCGDVVDLPSAIAALREQTKAIKTRDLSRAESMLVAQTHILDAVFNKLILKSANAEHPHHFELFLKSALRAQSQCRATWETISTIQNPPTTNYIAQSNIAHGPQQVNNNSNKEKATDEADGKQKTPNKLMEINEEERLDPREARTPSKDDSAVATLVPIHRASHK